MDGWLLLTFLIYSHNQLSSVIHSIITYENMMFEKKYGCLKNVIHQIDIKNEWLLVPASFSAKFRLASVLDWEMLFLRGFKASRIARLF